MNKKSSMETAYENIMSLIANQKLLPGQQIVETNMAILCGTSRTPVREAIRRLENDGLVEIIPNKGAFLKNLAKIDIVMGYETDAALEGMAAYLIAERVVNRDITIAGFSEAERCLQEMEQFIQQSNTKDWAKVDEEFHSLLMQMSDNRYLIQQRKQIIRQLNQVLWFVTPMYIDKSVSNSEHRILIETLKSGDCEKSNLLAHAHRMRMRNILKQTL